MAHPRKLGIGGLATLALALGASAGGGQELAWTGSVQYAQGKYIFTETTRSWSLFTGLTWQGSRLRLSLGLPVVAQDSRAITYVGELPLPTGGPDQGAVARKNGGEPVPMGGKGSGGGGPNSGSARVLPLGRQTTEPATDSVQAPGSTSLELADPVVSGALQLLAPRGSFMGLDLTASVQIPVRALDSGVGTGETDFGVGLSASVGQQGVLFFADVGWWRYGDLPDLVLKDVVSYGVGVGKLFGTRVSGLVSVSGSTGVMDAVDPPAEVGGLLSIIVGEGKSVTVGGGFGLTEASPDLFVSLGSRITLRNR